MTTASSTSPPPWHTAYPAPKTDPTAIRREDVLLKMQNVTENINQDFILVDLRRNDYEGGTIRGSINVPAQSLYPTIPTLYALFKNAGVRKVIWFCSSSKGRGTRAAGWFADHIAEHGDEEMKSLVLLEGIKGWATAGSEFTERMHEYNESIWAKVMNDPVR